MPTEAEILERCEYLRSPTSGNIFFCRLSEGLLRLRTRCGYMCDNGLCTFHCGLPQRLKDTSSIGDPLTDTWFREMIRGARKSILISYHTPPPGLDVFEPDFDYARGTFDERFCHQFFGRGTEGVAQVFWLLTQVNYIVNIDLPREYAPWAFPLFWDDPFRGKYSVNVKESWRLKTGRWLMEISSSALKIIFHNQRKVSKNEEWLDDLSFAARQIGHLGKRLVSIEEAKNSYRRAYENLNNEKIVAESLNSCTSLLRDLRKSLFGLEKEYQRLWLRENQEPGLEYNLNRFESVIKSYDKEISELEKVRRDYEEPGGSLPKKKWTGIGDY